MTFACIAAEKASFKVTELCRALDVSPSGYDSQHFALTTARLQPPMIPSCIAAPTDSCSAEFIVVQPAGFRPLQPKTTTGEVTDRLRNIRMEPTCLTVRAIMSPRHAAHSAR